MSLGTRSSATANGSRDALCQSKSCQLQTNPYQIEVTELKDYSRPSCNKLCATSHDATDCRRCNPQARPSTIEFVDDKLNLPWQNFLSPEFGTKFQWEVLLFWRHANFLTTECGIGERHAKNQLDSSSRFDTIPTCDGRTDIQTDNDSKYRASLAMRGKQASHRPQTPPPVLTHGELL